MDLSIQSQPCVCGNLFFLHSSVQQEQTEPTPLDVCVRCSGSTDTKAAESRSAISEQRRSSDGRALIPVMNHSRLLWASNEVRRSQGLSGLFGPLLSSLFCRNGRQRRSFGVDVDAEQGRCLCRASWRCSDENRTNGGAGCKIPSHPPVVSASHSALVEQAESHTRICSSPD